MSTPLNHNYFFAMPDMPWKTPTNCEVPSDAIQTEGPDSPCEAGEEVESSEEVPLEERGDTTSSRTGSD